VAVPWMLVREGVFGSLASSQFGQWKLSFVRCRNELSRQRQVQCEPTPHEKESPFPDSKCQEFLAGLPDVGIVVQANRRFVRRNLWLLECFRCVGSLLALCRRDADEANSDALADDAL